MQNLVHLISDGSESNSFVIFQFYKPVASSDRGFYDGNEVQTIQREHGYFISSLPDKFIEFYKRENATSVVDFGCGKCDYIRNIKEAGFDVKAYDGNPYTPQITNGFGEVLDLVEMQDLKRKFDWVQSLEVGEHIPPAKTAVLV